jgi:hypothetical protein
VTVERRRWQELAGKAAAELAIVVVGVTLALWADDWASERADRQKERSRLIALRDNIDVTLLDVEEHLRDAVEASRNLRAIVSEVVAPPNEMRDRISWGLFYGPVFSPQLNVYDDLKNSGELSLLTNPLLRSALARMDASMGRIELAQSDLTSVQQMHIDSYSVDSTNVRIFYGEELGLTRPDVTDTNQLEFANEPGFKSRMVLKLDLVSQLEMRFREAKDVLLDVRTLIDEQLGRDQF